MKNRLKVIAMAGLWTSAAVCLAASTGSVDSVDKFSWGENIGWMNWADADQGMGVMFMPNHLSGFLWCENVGHINAGNGGGPYANTNNTNFGVNIASDGTLYGFAWGENIGWVNFTTSSLGGNRARYDSVAGRLRGYAWGENIGWINLNDATHFVGVNPACAGNANGDASVNIDDLNIVLSQWAASVVPCTGGDLDGSGVVDIDDLNQVLSNWNQSCP